MSISYPLINLGSIQNLQTSLISQTSFLVGTFSVASYSKTAQAGKVTTISHQKTRNLITNKFSDVRTLFAIALVVICTLSRRNKLISLVAHRISNIWFDFFQLRLPEETSRKYSDFDTFKSIFEDIAFLKSKRKLLSEN